MKYKNINVTHPNHYQKNDGHPECIDLLKIICKEYSGFDALCAGQSKYLYRCGSKADNGRSIKDKAIEDLNKFKQYMLFMIKNHETDVSFRTVTVFDKTSPQVTNVAKEFSYDKPEWAKSIYEEIIARLITEEFVNGLKTIVELTDKLISLYENNF